MPRWVSITEDSIKAAGHGDIIDRARTLAVGALDPLDEAIKKTVARVRRAVATGNVLDADETKIPGSLEDVAVRLALSQLCWRLRFELDDDVRDQIRADREELKSIRDNKAKVELPDVPEPQETFAPTGMKAESVNVPRRQTGRDRTSGL